MNLIVCGNTNDHNNIRGNGQTDQNGREIEKFAANSNLVILNDGRGTRLDPQTGKLSCLDITLGTPALAAQSKTVSLT